MNAQLQLMEYHKHDPNCEEMDLDLSATEMMEIRIITMDEVHLELLKLVSFVGEDLRLRKILELKFEEMEQTMELMSAKMEIFLMKTVEVLLVNMKDDMLVLAEHQQI